MAKDCRSGEKGTPGRPVDVVIIDTLEKFIATGGPQTAIRLGQVVTELRSRNIAVLLVAHADETGENIRGFKNKTDNFCCLMDLCMHETFISWTWTFLLKNPFCDSGIQSRKSAAAG